MNRLYQMNREEYQGLLKVASEQVPFGIYAIEKADYAELRDDRCESVTQLKRQIREYRKQGFYTDKAGSRNCNQESRRLSGRSVCLRSG